MGATFSNPNDTEAAEETLREWEQTRGDVVALATVASLARRIEPELLRTLRLKLARWWAGDAWPTVGTEAALWFSPLVESRGPDSITLLAPFNALLRERLQARGDLLEAARAIVERCHAAAPPVIRWEEALVYLSLSARGTDDERRAQLEHEIWRAVKGLASGTRRGLGECIVEMGARLPELMKSAPPLARLLTTTQVLLARDAPGDSPAGFVTVDFSQHPQRTLEIARVGDSFRIGDLAGAGRFGLRVPHLEPVTLQVLPATRSDRVRTVTIPAHGFAEIPVARGLTRLRTIDGKIYELDPAAALHEESGAFERDVFLSGELRNDTRVRRLEQRLKEANLALRFDDAELRSGESWPAELKRAVEQCRAVLCFFTWRGHDGSWTALPIETVWRTIENPRRRFIPVRISDGPVPEPLRRMATIDLQSDDPRQYERLLRACRPPASSDAAPDRPVRLESEKVFRGHTGAVWRVTSPHGARAYSASDDHTLRVWELGTGECVRVFQGHTAKIFDVIESLSLIYTASADRTVCCWNPSNGQIVRKFLGHEAAVSSVATSPNGQLLVSSSFDGTIRVWECETGRLVRTLEGHAGSVLVVRIAAYGRAPRGRRRLNEERREVLSGGGDGTVRIWDVASGRSLHVLRGHTAPVDALAATPGGHQVISGSRDGTVRVWERSTGRCARVLEGHTGSIVDLAILDGLSERVVSSSLDGTLRVWHLPTGSCLGTLAPESACPLGLAALPGPGQFLVGTSEHGVWQCQVPEFRSVSDATSSRSVATAKVVLLGDPGVGKTALARRLTGASFEPTTPTHGRSILRLQIAEGINDDVEREVWLWEFGGSPDQSSIHGLGLTDTQRIASGKIVKARLRAVHGLGLKDAALVLVVADLANGEAPAAAKWLRVLDEHEVGAAPRLLVVARSDIGASRIDRSQLERFCDEHGFQGFVQVSAKTGEGCEELRKAIAENIRWGDIALSTRSHVSRATREAVMAARAENIPLLRATELRQRMQVDFGVGDQEIEALMTVLRPLEQQGLVSLPGFGGVILLQPEWMDIYAAALLRAVRHAPEGYDFMAGQTLSGDRSIFSDMERLAEADETLVLIAVEAELARRSLDLGEHKPDVAVAAHSAGAIAAVRPMHTEAARKRKAKCLDLLLIGHATAVSAEVGHVFRLRRDSQVGLAGEIELRDPRGEPVGVSIALAFATGEGSRTSAHGQVELPLPPSTARWLELGRELMLVHRVAEGQIEWVNATGFLRKSGGVAEWIPFLGEPFLASSLARLASKFAREE